MTSLRELLEDLEARGRVSAGTVARAERALARERDETPWFVTLLMGAGAWLATIFFLVGAAAMLNWGGGWTSWAAVAVVFLGLGLGLRRFSDHVFVGQLSLGLTLAGWSAGVVAGGELLDADVGGAALAGCLLAAVVYVLHPDVGARFFVSVAALGLFTTWCFVESDALQHALRNLPIVVGALGAGALFVRPGLPRRLVPLAYAFAVTLAFTTPLVDAVPAGRESVAHWPAVLVLTVGLAVFTWRLARSMEAETRSFLLPVASLGVLGLGAAGWLGGPGLLAAAGLLVLGHASARRPLELLGLLALPVSLFLFYRDLDVPLLVKSAAVVSSGIVLLGVRALLAKGPWARETT